MCPFCPDVGSVLARELGPGRGGLVKNGRDRAAPGDERPPRSLDQWSIPLSGTPPIGFLPQLRSVKRAASGLFPECTGQAGRGSAGILAHARMTGSAVHQNLVLPGRSVCTVESAGHRPVGAENLCHQAIFMNHVSGAVAPEEAEVVQVGDAIGQRAKRRGLVQGAVRPVRVIEILVLTQHCHQVPLVPDQGPVQQLTPTAADPAFHDRVAPRRQLHLIRVIGTDASG
jgi:hypothetical protein